LDYYDEGYFDEFQVGIELVPRDYDMNSPTPFHKTDIVSLIPVHKVRTN